jgi:hypothetical protein
MVSVRRKVTEILTAFAAIVRLFSAVDSEMGHKLMLLSKCPATMRTLVWLFPGVYSLMGSFLLTRHELLRTELTAVPPVPDMTPLVDVSRVPPAEGFTAMLAHKRFDGVMLRNVAVVAVLPSKRLGAKLARVGSNS